MCIYFVLIVLFVYSRMIFSFWQQLYKKVTLYSGSPLLLSGWIGVRIGGCVLTGLFLYSFSAYKEKGKCVTFLCVTVYQDQSFS